MSLTVASLIAAIINSALGTFVWVRYRQQRLGRLFASIMVLLLLLDTDNVVRRTTTSAGVAFYFYVATFVLLSLLALTLLWFFCALYAPEWWKHPTLMRWIAVPYLLAAAILLLDGVMRAGLVIAGLRDVGTVLIRSIPGPLAIPLSIAFALGWLPHLAVLLVAFVRQPDQRRPIAVLGATIVLTSITGSLDRLAPSLSFITAVFGPVALVGALSYLLLRRRIFETTKVVMDQALESMEEGIAIVGPDGPVLFANRAIGELLGLRAGQGIEVVAAHGFDLEALRTLLGLERRDLIVEAQGRTVAMSASPIHDEAGHLQGCLLLARDVSQTHAYERELRERQDVLLRTVEELQQAQATQQDLIETVRAISLPIIPVAPGVIVLPLIGALDERRAADFEQRLLYGVQEQQAHMVLLDLTGVPLIDEQVAQILLRAVRGAGLLGARTVLVGVRPEIAQSIVALELDLRALMTAPTLQEALAELNGRQGEPWGLS